MINPVGRFYNPPGCRLQPTCGFRALVSPPLMSSGHRILEPYGRWHATIYRFSDSNSDSTSMPFSYLWSRFQSDSSCKMESFQNRFGNQNQASLSHTLPKFWRQNKVNPKNLVLLEIFGNKQPWFFTICKIGVQFIRNTLIFMTLMGGRISVWTSLRLNG